MILIKGGEALRSGGWARVDVLVEGASVSDVAPNLSVPEATLVDATGMFVGPGLVDLHAHLREPGQTWKEDIESGSRAAAAGGFTAMVAMPNTDPPLDSAAALAEVVSRGREVGLAEVSGAGTVTRGRAGTATSDLDGLYRAGARLFTDDGDTVADERVLAEAMSRLARLPGAVLAQHAEDPSMTVGGHMHLGEMAARHGIGGLPAEAEVSIVERDLGLVAVSGVPYHCQHVSSSGTLDLLREAKARGMNVTAEVTPHHLTFDDRSLDVLDPDFKMYPPIRSESDRASLRRALIDRTIDIVATDHAPHSGIEKAVAFEDAPRGVIGLETAASAVWEVVEDPRLLFEVMSTVPARLGAFKGQGRPVEPGAPANLVVFDPGSSWVPRSFLSKSSNSPYKGRKMKGRVITTIYAGRVTHSEESGG